MILDDEIDAFYIFWRSSVIIFKFSSNKKLLEHFLNPFLPRIRNRILIRLLPDMDLEKFNNRIRIQAKTPDPD